MYSVVMTDEPEYLTIAEVAAILKVDKKTIRRRIAAGELPAVKIGSRAPGSARDTRQIRILASALPQILEPIRGTERVALPSVIAPDEKTLLSRAGEVVNYTFWPLGRDGGTVIVGRGEIVAHESSHDGKRGGPMLEAESGEWISIDGEYVVSTEGKPLSFHPKPS